MSDSAASTGARLRSAREQLGMSIEKAASALRLEPWVIETLEAGDPTRVGPPVYGKGFLRRYAALLELPVEDILAGFGLGAPVVSQAAHAAAAPPGLRRFSSGPALGVLLAALLLIALVWWKPWSSIGHRASSTAQTHAPAPDPASSVRVPDIAPEPPAQAADATPPEASGRRPAPPAKSGPTEAHPSPTVAGAHPPPERNAPAATAPGEQGSGRARLRLSFTADSWVDVRDAQGNKTFVGNGSANTVRTIAGQAPMHVYLRSGNGVQLEINGHAVAIGPQFFAGDVARFQAGADGVLRREPRESGTASTRPPS